MNPRPQGIPLRPDPDARRDAVVRSVVRAVLAQARSKFEQDRDAARLVRASWSRDRMALGLVQRAASAPAMTTTTGWAAELATTRVEDMLGTFGPASCGGTLLQKGTVLQFEGANKISIPNISTASPTFATFVTQGQSIPVRQFVTSTGISLDPRKLGAIFVLSHEMIASSHAEQLVQLVMHDSLGAALDAALFSNAAGSASQPPGLLNGVTPLSAATAGSQVAMIDDFAKLVAAVSPSCGMDICFVTDPGTAIKVAMAAMPAFEALGIPVLASNAVTVGTVICIGLPALVSAFDPAPRINASRDIEVPVAMDTAPPNDGSIGSVVLKSSYQTDSVAVRYIADVAWGVRTAAAVAVINGINW